MAVRITGTWLKKQAAPASGDETVWDSEITGFGVRLFAPTKRHATGARSFFVNYRIDGREKRFPIGAYPDWTAEGADKASRLLRPASLCNSGSSPPAGLPKRATGVPRWAASVAKRLSSGDT